MERDALFFDDVVRTAWMRAVFAVRDQYERAADVIQRKGWLRLHQGRLTVLLAVCGSWARPMPQIFRALVLNFLLHEHPTMSPLPEVTPVRMPFAVWCLVNVFCKPTFQIIIYMEISDSAAWIRGSCFVLDSFWNNTSCPKLNLYSPPLGVASPSRAF